MNISEDVNILNGLQVCRDKIEAKHYLKAHGIYMNEHELDALKSHCYTENEENTLTANQLNNVAGGMNEEAGVYERNLARFNAIAPMCKRPAHLSPYDKYCLAKDKVAGIPLDRIKVSGLSALVNSTVAGAAIESEAKFRVERNKNVWLMSYANDLRKKNGETELTTEEFDSLYASSRESSPVSDSPNSSESGSPPLPLF